MGTITKALELLGLFSTVHPALGLTEIVSMSGRDKATVLRHLTELRENGFVQQHPDTRAYSLGPALLRLAQVREATNPIRSVVAPIIAQCANETAELTHFSLLQGDALTPVAHADPKVHRTQVVYSESDLLPLHATSSGLAVLAFSDEAFVDRLLGGRLEKFTENTITDSARLRARLDDIRAGGISSSSGSFDTEVISHAAPVFGARHNVDGAVAVALPTGRQSAEKLAGIDKSLKRAAIQISNAIGGTLPDRLTAKWAAKKNGSTHSG